MIKLTFDCDSAEQANIYISAPQLHNLLSDFALALRTSQKHGEDSDVLRTVTAFADDIFNAVDHANGPY